MAPHDTLAAIETSWTTCTQSNWKLQGSLRPPAQVQRQRAVDVPERCMDELQQPRAPSSIEQEPELSSFTIPHSVLHTDAKADTTNDYDAATKSTALLVEELTREEPVRSKIPSHDTASYPQSAVVDTEASLTSLGCKAVSLILHLIHM